MSSNGNGNGHGNPRPDLFHDRRGEGRRTAPYALIRPTFSPLTAQYKHGGKVLAPSGQMGETMPETGAFKPRPGDSPASFGTHVPITYS